MGYMEYYEGLNPPGRKVPIDQEGVVQMHPTWHKWFAGLRRILLTLYPDRTSQSTQPTINTGELRMWRDTDDDKTYLIYNDPDVGARKVELT